MRIVRTGRQKGDVAGLDLEQLAGHAQRAPTFEDDESLFLGVMQVVGAAAHARRDDVDADAEGVGSGARSSRSIETSSKLRISWCRSASARSLMGRSEKGFAP